MGNNVLHLLHTAKNARTPLFLRSHGQQPPDIDTPCRVFTYLALPAVLMGSNLLI